MHCGLTKNQDEGEISGWNGFSLVINGDIFTHFLLTLFSLFFFFLYLWVRFLPFFPFQYSVLTN